MSDTTQELQKFGAQKISEDTHIPINYIQSLLDEKFGNFTRVQFLGFISILEREYHIDLHDLKERALAFFKEHEEEEIFDTGVFVTPSKSKNFAIFYIFIAIIIFLVALYYTFGVAKNINERVNAVDNSAIEKAAETIKEPLVKVESNVTNESNVTTTQTEPVVIKKRDKATVESLEIKPRSKVWLGYIDVATNERHQRTFIKPLELDPKKEWIMLFGHGYVDVNLNGKDIKFNTKKTLRLWYKNGILQEINADEFKQLNRGNKW